MNATALVTLRGLSPFLSAIGFEQRSNGKLMLAVIGAVGQSEREAMLERQREGIAKAKREGRYGRCADCAPTVG